MRGGVGVRELHEVIRALLFLEHAREREAVILGLEERVDGGDGKVSGRGTECVARVARGTNDEGGGGRIRRAPKRRGRPRGRRRRRRERPRGRRRRTIQRRRRQRSARRRGRARAAASSREGRGTAAASIAADEPPGRTPEGVSELARAGRRGRVRGVETPASRQHTTCARGCLHRVRAHPEPATTRGGVTRRPRARDVSFRDPSRAFPAAEKHSCLAHFRIVRWTLTSDDIHLRIFMSVHPYKMFVLHFRRVVNRSFRVLLFSRLRTRSAQNQNLVPPSRLHHTRRTAARPGRPVRSRRCRSARASASARRRRRRRGTPPSSASSFVSAPRSAAKEPRGWPGRHHVRGRNGWKRSSSSSSRARAPRVARVRATRSGACIPPSGPATSAATSSTSRRRTSPAPSARVGRLRSARSRRRSAPRRTDASPRPPPATLHPRHRRRRQRRRGSARPSRSRPASRAAPPPPLFDDDDAVVCAGSIDEVFGASSDAEEIDGVAVGAENVPPSRRGFEPATSTVAALQPSPRIPIPSRTRWSRSAALQEGGVDDGGEGAAVAQNASRTFAARRRLERERARQAEARQRRQLEQTRRAADAAVMTAESVAESQKPGMAGACGAAETRTEAMEMLVPRGIKKKQQTEAATPPRTWLRTR